MALFARREDTVVEARVDEALVRRPAVRLRVVEVDCSPVPKVRNGYANELPPPQPVQLVTVRLPMLAMFAFSWVVVATFAIETTPFVLMLKAETEEVAKEVCEEVARSKRPPVFLKTQWSTLAP